MTQRSKISAKHFSCFERKQPLKPEKIDERVNRNRKIDILNLRKFGEQLSMTQILAYLNFVQWSRRPLAY